VAYTITVDAEAFYDGSVYTYVYEVSSTGNVLPVEILTVDSPNFPSTLVLNTPASGYDYGVIHALAPVVSPRLALATSNGNLSFYFAAGVTPATPITVYAQAAWPPSLFPYFGQDGGQASGALTLAPVPESGSTMAFLGLGLLAVALASRRIL
jgi:hypothetical protein